LREARAGKRGRMTGEPNPQGPTDEVPAREPSSGENVCPECSGSGERDGSECPACGGSGVVNEAVGGG
jgi:DnaJ-class molecular chaperone